MNHAAAVEHSEFRTSLSIQAGQFADCRADHQRSDPFGDRVFRVLVARAELRVLDGGSVIHELV